MIQIRDTDTDPYMYRNTGKLCLGRGMHCAIASIFDIIVYTKSGTTIKFKFAIRLYTAEILKYESRHAVDMITIYWSLWGSRPTP